MTLEHVLWTERYRPRTIDDCILPEGLKKTFKQILKDGHVPNLLLSGPPGVGKTTVAKALLEQLGADYIVINGSMNGNIDTLRNEIKNYASTVSIMSGGRKYVILDEADYLNCFTGSQEILVIVDGYTRSMKLEELEGKELEVQSFNFSSQTLETTPAHVVEMGEKEVFEVEFEDGSKMWCTKDHKFFDENGNEMSIDLGNSLFDV